MKKFNSQTLFQRVSKMFLGFCLSLVAVPGSYGKDCTVMKGLDVGCYQARETPELRVALLYYGEFWTPVDLIRFESFLQKRFSQTTSNEITLKVVGSKVLPFRHKMPTGYAYQQITDAQRLQRIWYWQNVGTSVGEEIYSEYKKNSETSSFEDVDLILGVTGAQVDGNGFGAGAVVVVEQPREIAWGLDDGGSTEILSDAQLADVLIHEIGHSLSLGHANDQCAAPELSIEDSEVCCAKSPSKDDIMGYCRDRTSKKVNETSFNKFEACTLDILKSRVIPLMTEGDRRRIDEVLHCE